MATVTIGVDDAEVLAALAQLESLDGNMGRAFARAGEYELRATRDRAALEVSPDGVPWAALSPRYARRKAIKRPGVKKLKFDFHMLGDEFTYEADTKQVVIGTNVPYGLAMQYGRPDNNTPARLWLGFSAQDIVGEVAIFEDEIKLALSGR